MCLPADRNEWHASGPDLLAEIADTEERPCGFREKERVVRKRCAGLGLWEVTDLGVWRCGDRGAGWRA